MEEKVIEIRGLQKDYDGFSLKNVDLNVTSGRIHGFIGQNGAGKTTTIKAMLNMIPLKTGDIKIFGKDFQKEESEIKEDMGVVFDEMGFHEFMSPKQIDTMMSYVYQNWDSKVFQNYLSRFGLPYKKACGKFSRGMRMKLQIAVALSHHARLLVLDEPTAGLDPAGTASMMALFSKLNKEMHKTVLMVTHDMENVYTYCDDVVVLEKGQVKLHGTAREFFSDPKKCRELNILPPYIVRMKEMLNEKGFDIPESVVNMKELADYIAKEVK